MSSTLADEKFRPSKYQRSMEGKSISVSILIVIVLVLSGCAGADYRAEVTVTSQQSSPDAGELLQTGNASWYGGKFHGRKTASGEIFNKWDNTAAHRTLPLGSWLIVERVSNGRTVKVKVNDRGPFIEGRIIDLARGAAKELRMVDDGVARVRLYGVSGSGSGNEPEPADVEAERPFTIQVGSFVDESSALEVKNRLTGEFDNIHLTFALGKYHRVRVGYYDTRSAAEEVASTLQSMGYETWIVRESPK